MKMLKRLLAAGMSIVACTAGAGPTATAANAATPVINDKGILTGATGVTISGKTYDVEFKDGTCAQVFGKCGEGATFDFATQATATAAGQALLDQVFLDSSAGKFDTKPALTFGCADLGGCNTIVAFGSVSEGFYPYMSAVNTLDVNGDSVVGRFFSNTNADRSQTTLFNFARFTLSTSTGAVPEPATWAMMIAGFGMIGGALRRRTSSGRRALA